MSKILGIHTLELCPDVNEQEFEKFVTEELSTYFWHTSGYSHHIFKGIKGDRAGKYLLMFKIEGDKAQKHYFAPEEIKNNIMQQLHDNHPNNTKLLNKFKSMVTGFTINFTDYIEIE